MGSGLGRAMTLDDDVEAWEDDSDQYHSASRADLAAPADGEGRRARTQAGSALEGSVVSASESESPASDSSEADFGKRAKTQRAYIRARGEKKTRATDAHLRKAKVAGSRGGERAARAQQKAAMPASGLASVEQQVHRAFGRRR